MSKKVGIFLAAVNILFLSCGLAFSAVNETILIDDFERGSYFNYRFGEMGGDTAKPGTTDVGFSEEDTINGKTLAIKYDVEASDSFTLFWCKLGKKKKQAKFGSSEHFDASGMEYISFYVKGSNGGENCRIEIHEDIDDDNIYTFGTDVQSNVELKTYLPNGVTKDWQKVIIPLQDFKYLKEKKSLLEITFVFEDKNNQQSKKSTLFLDSFLFGSQLSARPELDTDAINYVFLSGNKVVSNGSTLKFPMEMELEVKSGLVRNGLEGVSFYYAEEGSSEKIYIGSDYKFEDMNFNMLWNPYGLSPDLKYELYIRPEYGNSIDVPFLKVAGGITFEALTDAEFLDAISKASFRYFVDYYDAETGLIADNSYGGYSSIAVTGFGLAAFTVAVERGWMSEVEAKKMINKTISTFLSAVITAEQKDGVFYHFLDMHNAKRAGDCEISVVDTALLAAGALVAGEYFGGRIAQKADQLYKNINWKSMYVKDKKVFSAGWTPEDGYLKVNWDYFTDEAIIITLLAAASPTYPVEAESYYSFKREWGPYKDSEPFIYSYFGSLFCHQYAHMWFDFRDIKDRDGVNWFDNSRKATLANRDFCVDNMDKYETYGPYSWCVSSAYTPEGYLMDTGVVPSGIGKPDHDGTISLPGIMGSLPFTPDTSIRTIRHLLGKYPSLWSHYGIKNSMNIDRNFIAPAYYGLDCGLVLFMVENFRDGFIWKNFMKNKYIKEAISKAEFVKESQNMDFMENAKSLLNEAVVLQQTAEGAKTASAYYNAAKAYIIYLDFLRKDNMYTMRVYTKDSIKYYQQVEALLGKALDAETSAYTRAEILINSYVSAYFMYKAEDILEAKWKSLIEAIDANSSKDKKRLWKMIESKFTVYGIYKYEDEIAANN